MAQSKRGGTKITKNNDLPKDKLLPSLTKFFFTKRLLTSLIWIVLVVFGSLSYTTLLKREGFPSVTVPISIVGGTYFVNDSAKVDADVANKIATIASEQNNTKSISSNSGDNFFTLRIQYKDGVDAKQATAKLETLVKDTANLPKEASVSYNVPYFGATGGDVDPLDMALSFYAKDNAVTTNELLTKANQLANALTDARITGVQKVFIKSPLQTVQNPLTGQKVTVERYFDRYGERINGTTTFYNSIIIGIKKTAGTDVIKLDEHVRSALKKAINDDSYKDFGASVSASFAPSIEDNISELQRVLLEGLIAVLVVGSIVIAIRASLITVVSMVTVIVSAIGLLYLLGYSLNVITLFGLILGLALIVDDTIIMVEAIDAARKKEKTPHDAVMVAARKVSRAMLAATLTASLCFAPLLFVSGILGTFIRAVPITIIASLLISLFVALIFIPFFARFTLLTKKQMGKHASNEFAAGFEAKIAATIAGPMLWARHSTKRLFSVGITAVIIGLGFLAAGGMIAQKVVFNIFPPTKDTNGIIYTINFPANTTIGGARTISEKAESIAAESLGDSFVYGSYYNTGNAQSATHQIQLTSYNKRSITSQQLVKQLQEKFDSTITDAKISVGQSDVGPPAGNFVVEFKADKNRAGALKAAQDMAVFLQNTKLKRASGKEASFKNITVSTANEYIRSDGVSIVSVSAGFDANDTTTLVTLAQDSVKKSYTQDKLASFGLQKDDIIFNLGQESENQDSFKTLALAFPVLLLVMYFLLAVEFRSFLQPLLIFMAIPFSIFGVMFGLYITNNAISFFAMLGFFALIGLSIKNTILLTDYANQARHSGMSAIDAAVAALEERFRPLFATSLTAVVSLIPLAISSPFWQGLAVVLIFGLLSSTLLVLTVFPYYYLGAEYLRIKFTPQRFLLWAIVTTILSILANKFIGGPAVIVVVIASLLLVAYKALFVRVLARR